MSELLLPLEGCVLELLLLKGCVLELLLDFCLRGGVVFGDKKE